MFLVVGLFAAVKSVIVPPKPRKTESLETALKQVIGAGEWVLAKGYYSAVISEPDEKNKQAEVYFEGLVRVGIDLADLEFRQEPLTIAVYYPAPRLLGVDLGKDLYFAEKFDRGLYNDALFRAKHALFRQAVNEGIGERAEENLRSELELLASELAPGSRVVMVKGAAPGERPQ